MHRMSKNRLLAVCAATLVFSSTVYAKITEGEGLRAIKAVDFRLERDVAGDARRASAIALLPQMRVTLDQVLQDCNRDGERISSVPGVNHFFSGFEWQSDDGNSKNWYPQGITGRVINERNILLVSWYDRSDTNRGVRISFCDLTDPNSPRYRHVLLVDAVKEGTGAKMVPVRIHAGGIAWVGDFIYVADTHNGFRVFDTREIRQIPSDELAKTFDYKYVLTQTSAWKLPAGSKTAIFSSVSVDRTTSPPSLVTCEYHEKSLAGRVFRWQLDAKGRLAAANGRTTVCREAYTAGQNKIQGAARYKGEWFLSCSSQKLTRGSLYAVKPNVKSAERSWCYGPESLHVATGPYLWSLSEHPGNRKVFRVRLAKYDTQ